MYPIENVPHYAVISENLRVRILHRSAEARDRDEVVAGIFFELRSANVDIYSISLEEFKTVLFEAICAAKKPASIGARAPAG